MSSLDAYFHRTVALRAGGRRLELATSQELFSSHQVDRGSRLLLRVVGEVLGDALSGASVLDVGCGYGPLGLGLRAMGSGPALLVDRDALAVRYAASNADSNGLEEVETAGSLGYHDVAGPVDVVVANVPGHASPATARHFVQCAADVLAPGGRAGFVVVDPLADAVTDALAAAGGEIEREVADRGHVVTIARFDAAAGGRVEAMEADGGLESYRRGEVAVEASGQSWTVDAAEGVPEFERLSHHTTELLARVGREPAGAVAVWNPGQGHVPIYLAATGQARSLVLADRDLLALRFSEANLARNRLLAPTALLHDIDLGASTGGPFDLVVDLLRRSEPAAAAAARISHSRSLLEPGGVVVATGGKTVVRRVETALVAVGVAGRRTDGRRAAVLRVPA